jgi:lipopolysaccharide biosynthesis regulator YciM
VTNISTKVSPIFRKTKQQEKFGSSVTNYLKTCYETAEAYAAFKYFLNSCYQLSVLFRI